MILTDRQILAERKKGTIIIRPFDRPCLGSNSCDVHLGPWLAMDEDEILDCRQHNRVRSFRIPKEGIVLVPSKLYLGVTRDYTETHRHVPFLGGKSSIGRLGIDIHATASKGDVGFCNHWTLEISVRQPARIYAGMPIGQLIYFEVSGTVDTPYGKKRGAKYVRKSAKPVESMMYRNFDDKR